MEMKNKVKINKDNFPLRPIVTKWTGPTYNIRKAVVSFVSTILPQSNHVLNSTVDFINKIKYIKLKENIIIESVDIVSLYPPIDLNQVKEFVIDSIEANIVFNTDIKTTLK